MAGPEREGADVKGNFTNHRLYPERANSTLAFCVVCGLPLLVHLRCRACSVLLGPGHEDSRGDERGLCGACCRYLAGRLARV